MKMPSMPSSSAAWPAARVRLPPVTATMVRLTPAAVDWEVKLNDAVRVGPPSERDALPHDPHVRPCRQRGPVRQGDPNGGVVDLEAQRRGGQAHPAAEVDRQRIEQQDPGQPARADLQCSAEAERPDRVAEIGGHDESDVDELGAPGEVLLLERDVADEGRTSRSTP